MRKWIDENYRLIMLGLMVAEVVMLAYLCFGK